MGVFVVAMMVTALWIVLGAVLHGGTEVACDTGEVWWDLMRYQDLPPTHPLARATRSTSIG